MRANATALQGASATGRFIVTIATLFSMNLEELIAFRMERLKAAVKHFKGSKTALGVALGYTDGAFIRQMLLGKRHITENTTRAIEGLEGMADWFTPPNEPLTLTPEERDLVLTHRAVKRRANPYIEASDAPDNKTGRRKRKPPKEDDEAQGGLD